MDYFYLAFAWLLYFAGHSILAANSSKIFVQKHLKKLFPYYRLFFNLMAILLLLPLLNYQQSLDNYYIFNPFWLTQILGYSISGLGIVGLYLAFKSYDSAEFFGLDFNQKKNEKAATLSTTGFNQYVRHPLYFATILLVWGYFLAQATLTILTVSLCISLYLIVGTKLEEQKLLKEFGSQYEDYIQKVPMLLPFLKK